MRERTGERERRGLANVSVGENKQMRSLHFQLMCTPSFIHSFNKLHHSLPLCHNHAMVFWNKTGNVTRMTQCGQCQDIGKENIPWEHPVLRVSSLRVRMGFLEEARCTQEKERVSEGEDNGRKGHFRHKVYLEARLKISSSVH